MKTYTKTGDNGSTSLIGGERVPKYDDRIEAYGSIDELSAFIGLLYDSEPLNEEQRNVLLKIQNILFTIEAQLASSDESLKTLPNVNEEDINFIEKQIDTIESQLPPLNYFVIPGGNIAASRSHVCRTVCRRAERCAIKSNITHPINPINLRYLNRLSDYFFVLSRELTMSQNKQENNWNPES